MHFFACGESLDPNHHVHTMTTCKWLVTGLSPYAYSDIMGIPVCIQLSPNAYGDMFDFCGVFVLVPT